MMNRTKILCALLLAAALAACATPEFGAKGPGETRTTKAGEVLVDARGMTLYTYDKDTPGKSACTGICAVAWPPVLAAKGAEAHDGFTLIARGDERQWAYKGHPLYGYIRDTEPGEVTGDGADGGVWHAARK